MISPHFAPRIAEPVNIGGIRFDHASYDAAADYLYFTKGVSLGFADDDTREGHTVFADHAQVTGVLLNGARLHLDRDGAIAVTLHEGGPTTRLERTVVEPLLVDAPRY